MKIAFFETSKSDKEYLSRALGAHELLFFAEPLTESNASQAAEYEIISVFIYSTVSATVLGRLRSLRCIATRSTGFDHIDVATCQEKNIAVLNVPYYGENTVAEHAFALAFDRQSVDVAAVPAFAVPAISIAALSCLILGQVEAEKGQGLATVFLHHFIA